MDFLLTTILAYLLIYKYAVLFTVTLLAAIALPIPSAATLMASAAFASQGYFNMGWVIFTAGAGNVLGDNIGYWLARRFGRPVLYKLGLRRMLNSPVLAALERQVELRPALIIFFSRFEVLATLSVNFISGLSRIRYIKYLMWEIPGELVQVLMYAGIGYSFGASWTEVNGIIGKFSLLIGLVIVLLILSLWKRIIKRLTRTAS